MPHDDNTHSSGFYHPGLRNLLDSEPNEEVDVGNNSDLTPRAPGIRKVEKPGHIGLCRRGHTRHR